MTETKVNINGKNLSKIERWISAFAGSSMIFFGLTRKKRASFGSAMMAIGGAELIRRALTGKSILYNVLGVNTAEKGKAPIASVAHGEGIKHVKTVTINKSPAELHQFWRNLENLPRFMEHLESVQELGDNTSHWVAKAPAGTTVEWDAIIHNEIPNELIAWRTVEGSEINHAGSVEFKGTVDGQSTVVKVELNYEPPAGKVGAALAKIFGKEPGQQLDHDLRRFKQLMETGEIATTEGQPVGRASRKAEKALKGI